jgi:hypothetical protein
MSKKPQTFTLVGRLLAQPTLQPKGHALALVHVSPYGYEPFDAEIEIHGPQAADAVALPFDCHVGALGPAVREGLPLRIKASTTGLVRLGPPRKEQQEAAA